MVRRASLTCSALGILTTLTALGCQSPYRADRGALFGGLLGAGTGAIVGNAVGNTGAGTAIGAGLGALTGATVGGEMDQIEAENRAMIAQQLGREVAAGAVGIGDVVAMTQAGVDEELIVNHVRTHGVAAPLQTSDLIYLQQQNVGKRVIAAMQEPPRRVVQPAVVGAPGAVIYEPAPPVVVHHYDPYYWGPPYHYRHGWAHARRPGVSWGMSFSN